MPVAYPLNLRTVQAAKSRSQPAPFSLREPRRGMGYVQRTGTDTPVFWDVQFVLSATDAVRWQLWFTQDLARGALPFTMALRTEFGLLDHVCQFLPDGLGDCTEQGGIYTYSAKIMARAQIIPAAYLTARPFIDSLPDWGSWAVLLDRAIAALPES